MTTPTTRSDAVLPRSAPFAPSGRFARLGVACVLVSIAGASALAQNQVHIVGPASSATVLQAAIDAAADGDLLLVRAGVYGVAVIDGKSLTLQLDDVADSAALLHLSIRNLAAGEKVVVRGLRMHGGLAFPPVYSALAVWIRDCAGPVILEDCELLSGRPAAIQADNSSGVFLTRCVVHGSDGVPQIAFEVPPTPAVVASGSSLYVYACDLTGGNGTVFQDGAPALLQNGGFAIVSGSSAEGGNGGKAGISSSATCIAAGDGGPGYRVVGVAPGARVFDSSFVGGAGGPGEGICPPGIAAPPIEAPVGAVIALSEVSRLLVLGSPTREGGTLEFFVGGLPGETAKLLFAAQPAALFAPGLTGALLPAIPLGLIVLGALPASGQLTIAIPIPDPFLPPGIEGLEVYAQALFDGSVPGLGVLSSPSVAVLLDGGV